MLKTEKLPDGRVRHYSDADMMIRQIETGIVYEDAVDRTPLLYSYEETDTPIATEEATVEDKAEAYDILTGVSE